MCGIAGYLKTRHAPADRELLKSMCSRIAHRGPDAEGFYFNEGAGLGHRRLSVIDLSTGDQPLGNEDGSIQAVFNGEIYNFHELRDDLARKGHRFSTQSDTEVLVHLYEQVGEHLPEYLNGMFAFAIWDSPRRRLLLARDRLGKKPLYYSLDCPGLRFCFASELKALAIVPGFDAALNERAVADFLALSYVPDPETIYRKVHKLPPAHTLLVTDSDFRLRRYWTPEFSSDNASRVETVAEEIRTLAADAARRRMVSDVPLGAFLSGGVDSSAVVGIMAAQVRERVKTFSIGFTHKEFDEVEYARMAAQRNGTDHHEQIVTPDISEVLDTLVGLFDEPFGDSSAIPMLYLARMTRQHVTVALCGDGADELFGGYRRYRFGVLEQRLREKFPAWFRTAVFRPAARWYPKFDYLPRVFRAKTLLHNLAQEIGDAYFTSMSVFRDGGLSAALSPEIQTAVRGYCARDAFRARFTGLGHLDPLQQMQKVDLDTYLPGDILVKADRTTMAYSLESRSPWLDYRLAELAFRIPSSMKINDGTGKYVFKKAMEPYVPQALLRRPKMGFSVPLAAWFRTSLQPVFESSVLHSDGLLNPPYMRRIWEEHQSGLHNHDRKLWNALMLALWDARHRKSGFDHAMIAAGRN